MSTSLEARSVFRLESIRSSLTSTLVFVQAALPDRSTAAMLAKSHSVAKDMRHLILRDPEFNSFFLYRVWPPRRACFDVPNRRIEETTNSVVNDVTSAVEFLLCKRSFFFFFNSLGNIRDFISFNLNWYKIFSSDSPVEYIQDFTFYFTWIDFKTFSRYFPIERVPVSMYRATFSTGPLLLETTNDGESYDDKII